MSAARGRPLLRSSANAAASIRGPHPLVAHCASNHGECNTLASDVSARQKPELAEQIGLVEEQVLGGQLVAVHGVDRRPAKFDRLAGGSYIALRTRKDPIVCSSEDPLCGC
jgi:hypothetical protein